MPISKKEFATEEKRLEDTISIIRNKISNLGAELYDNQEKVLEFKKFLWDAHAEMDAAEMKTLMSNNDVEISIMMKRGEYLQKLFCIQNKPYFGSLIFQSNEQTETIYIGITHVEKNLKYYVHDWRSPICSMFYDYETGSASYEAPAGTITGIIQRKRQYTIENAQLIHVFDNEINIDDELLQEVLATESSEKMKNIVNTIQKEQNQVIRNIQDKNLIVQGIAGSGKTSVALHRIAFLLYKLPYLSSNNVLIFSPNKVFSEYISNVLPELGENNTKETSIHEFLQTYLKEFKKVESFTNFIERYYKEKKEINYSFIKYKQSDNIALDIDQYIHWLTKTAKFQNDLLTKEVTLEANELNYLLKTRYAHFPLFQRIEVIAEKICDRFFEGKLTKKKSMIKILQENLNIRKDYIQIYNNFFFSNFSKIKVQEKQIQTKKEIAYEDATIFVYMKSLLEGLNYNTDIQQIIIDEAQDYTKMQYLLLTKIFKNGSFTILGDIHQTINPYYQYKSLHAIQEQLPNSKYIELLKTYRSSQEIIEYTNKILNLKHISAIRRKNQKPILKRIENQNLKELLLNDILFLQKEYKSIAIITKTEEETESIYHQIKEKVPVTKLSNETEKYTRDLIILPSYLAKGLEFDAVIIYSTPDNPYTEKEKYLYYVACTRCQHQLIIYNQ